MAAGAATRCATGTTRLDCRAAARWGRPRPPPRTPSRCRGSADAAFHTETPERSRRFSFFVEAEHLQSSGRKPWTPVVAAAIALSNNRDEALIFRRPKVAGLTWPMALACQRRFPTVLHCPSNRIAKKLGESCFVLELLRLMADDCFTQGASRQRRVLPKHAGACMTFQIDLITIIKRHTSGRLQ